MKGESALWRAVITQALQDAGSKSKKREMIFHRNDATAWLRGMTEDFAVVCLEAGMNPEYVRWKAREALARGCVWRKPKGAGPRDQ